MNKKLFLTSILAIVFAAPAMAGLVPPPPPRPCGGVEYDLDQGMYYKSDGWTELGYPVGTVQTCRSGHYCPGDSICSGGDDAGINSCPSNYDNTATGLKTIEECCLDGYNSSTGLCNEGVFPSNGLMQENKTYFNAATEENMDGVYSGNVNAVAEYDLINYYLSAGQYLPADSETPTTCLAGSYCSGIGNVNYNQTSAQGIETCPEIDDAQFTSASGSSAVTSCYQDSAMSTATLNPFETAHLNTSKNTDGYTNGVKYAKATTTARRYATTTTTAGNWAALDESDLAITDLACENGYHYKAGTALDLTNLIGIAEEGVDAGYKSISGTGTNKNEDKYGITQNGEFVTDYGSKGKIHGHAQCSTQSGSKGDMSNGTYPDITTTATLPDSSGRYCYCQLDSYTPAGGSATALSAHWVFNKDYDNAGNCPNSCAYYCAVLLQLDNPFRLAFRAAVFGAVQPGLPTCEANTITINWKDVDETTAGQNNEGTATYGGDVRTPVKAETKPGKRFLGWIFSKPTEED